MASEGSFGFSPGMTSSGGLVLDTPKPSRQRRNSACAGFTVVDGLSNPEDASASIADDSDDFLGEPQGAPTSIGDPALEGISPPSRNRAGSVYNGFDGGERVPSPRSRNRAGSVYRGFDGGERMRSKHKEALSSAQLSDTDFEGEYHEVTDAAVGGDAYASPRTPRLDRRTPMDGDSEEDEELPGFSDAPTPATPRSALKGSRSVVLTPQIVRFEVSGHVETPGLMVDGRPIQRSHVRTPPLATDEGGGSAVGVLAAFMNEGEITVRGGLPLPSVAVPLSPLTNKLSVSHTIRSMCPLQVNQYSRIVMMLEEEADDPLISGVCRQLATPNADREALLELVTVRVTRVSSSSIYEVTPLNLTLRPRYRYWFLQPKVWQR
jgi:hypothetical protein